MKSELLSAFLDGLFEGSHLAVRLVVAGPIAIVSVCRSFVNRQSVRPSRDDSSRAS